MMKERKPREKRVVLKELPVMPSDSGTVSISFTAHHVGKLVVSFVYEDEISLFDISEFTFSD